MADPVDYKLLLKKYMDEVYETHGQSSAKRVILYCELRGDRCYSPEELSALRTMFDEAQYV